MDRPGTKHLIFMASDDAPHIEEADLREARKLRDRIDPAILRQVATVLAPRTMGDRRSDRIGVVDRLLGPGHEYRRPYRPEIFNAQYLQSRSRKFDESQTAVLAVIPASQIKGVIAPFVRHDTRRGAADIRKTVGQGIAPGTGIVAVYEGAWAKFDPAGVRIVQLSCPQAAECLKVPAVDDARRGAVLASALAGLVTLARRRRPEP